MTNDQTVVTDEMVTRFLSYKIPAYIEYTNGGNYSTSEARQMLEHVLGGDAWKRCRITPTFAPVVAVEPSNREAGYESLLKAASGQLRAWHQKYGNHAPSWLPPGGDVSLLETIDDWLDTNTTPTQPETTLKATP